MPAERSETLPVGLWLAELGRLAIWCAQATYDTSDQAIRRAFHLAVLAPEPFQRLTAPLVDLHELEGLLETDRPECAALALVGHQAIIDLVEMQDRDSWFASYSVEGDDPVVSEAPTASAALIRAWANFYCGTFTSVGERTPMHAPTAHPPIALYNSAIGSQSARPNHA